MNVLLIYKTILFYSIHFKYVKIKANRSFSAFTFVRTCGLANAFRYYASPPGAYQSAFAPKPP